MYCCSGQNGVSEVRAKRACVSSGQLTESAGDLILSEPVGAQLRH